MATRVLEEKVDDMSERIDEFTHAFLDYVEAQQKIQQRGKQQMATAKTARWKVFSVRITGNDLRDGNFAPLQTELDKLVSDAEVVHVGTTQMDASTIGMQFIILCRKWS